AARQRILRAAYTPLAPNTEEHISIMRRASSVTGEQTPIQDENKSIFTPTQIVEKLKTAIEPHPMTIG
ncbi:MAG: hypothetical protein ACK5JT_14225, partial [Hyphomicrobiaceae bacterium]